MIAAELRGGSKPSLNEALGWIGWRVDDIYGANVGRLDDVWIDPGTGSPRWVLVGEGRFGGRSTLIPFEDATAGAGHVWVPYERDIVRAAPEVEAGAPLTQELETALRAHYSASAQRSATRASTGAALEGSGPATIRFGRTDRTAEAFGRPAAAGPAPEPRVDPRAAVPYSEPPPPRMPERPAPPVEATRPAREAPPPPPLDYAAPRRQRPSDPEPLRYRDEEELVYRPAPEGDPYRYAAPAEREQPRPRQVPREPAEPARDPVQEHIEALRDLAAAGRTHFVEIELSGELSIRGELRSIRVTPHERRSRPD